MESTRRESTRRHVADTFQRIASQVDSTPEEVVNMSGQEFLDRREARRSDTVPCAPPVFDDEEPTLKMRRPRFAAGGAR